MKAWHLENNELVVNCNGKYDEGLADVIDALENYLPQNGHIAVAFMDSEKMEKVHIGIEIETGDFLAAEAERYAINGEHWGEKPEVYRKHPYWFAPDFDYPEPFNNIEDLLRYFAQIWEIE